MQYAKSFLFLLLFTLIVKNSFAQIEVDARHFILQDFDSGEILYEKSIDSKIYPASMTKIMTTIIAFDLIKKGEVSLDEKVTISEKAWRMSQSGYSSMFIMLNDKVSVEDLLKGIVIVSGNDACVALAEGIAGSENDFVILMNEKASEIGLLNTNFSNSSGINDVNNYSTVEDILILSHYLIKNYPEFYTYYKEKSFTWDRTGGDPITQGNRNPLLYKDMGADGIKTGFLTVEQYSLASSIKIGTRRLIAVGSGFKTKNGRSRESAKLLNWGLRKFDTFKIAKTDQTLEILNVWLGAKKKVEVIPEEDVYITIPKRKKSTIKSIIEYNGPVEAPIRKGDKIGELKVFIAGDLERTVNVLSKENIERANIFSRIFNSLNFLVWGDV